MGKDGPVSGDVPSAAFSRGQVALGDQEGFRRPLEEAAQGFGIAVVVLSLATPLLLDLGQMPALVRRQTQPRLHGAKPGVRHAVLNSRAFESDERMALVEPTGTAVRVVQIGGEDESQVF